MAPHEPAGERPQRDGPDRDQQPDVLAALLPHEDAQHHAAHPHHGQPRADHVGVPIPGVWDILEEPDLGQHHRDHDGLQQEADAPGQVGRDEAAQQRPDRGGDRRRRTDQRVGLLLRRSLEVAVDERLHRGQQQRGAEPADDRPENDDRRQVLGDGHGHRAGRVAQQPQHERPLAAEEVADLAADQDERGGDQRLERDRALDRADGRVEVIDHRGDRHVHQRRVDDEHEHRRRQHQRQARAARCLRHERESPRTARAAQGRAHYLRVVQTPCCVVRRPDNSSSARARDVGLPRARVDGAARRMLSRPLPPPRPCARRSGRPRAARRGSACRSGPRGRTCPPRAAPQHARAPQAAP